MARAALVVFVGLLPWIGSLIAGSYVSNSVDLGVGGAIAVFLATFIVTWLLVVCALGKILCGNIRAVKVQRSLKENSYFARALYGRVWTSLFYFKVLYSFVLANPWLRKFVFRSFGYTGSNAITIFPDAWIRDLPLLHWNEGSYIANRATIGTNLCLQDNTTVVGSVFLGQRCLVGHMSIIGLGTKLGNDSEIGVNSVIGIRVRIGEKTAIGGRATVNHGVKIGRDCMINAGCYLGIRSSVGDGIVLPQASIVPEGKIIAVQEDVEKLISSERNFIANEKDKIEKLLVKYNSHL